MQFLAGTIDAHGFKYVMIGCADPAVNATYLIQRASSDACDWGPNSSSAAIGHLVDLVLQRILPDSAPNPQLRKRLINYFRNKTESDKMWLVSHEKLMMEMLDIPKNQTM